MFCKENRICLVFPLIVACLRRYAYNPKFRKSFNQSSFFRKRFLIRSRKIFYRCLLSRISCLSLRFTQSQLSRAFSLLIAVCSFLQHALAFGGHALPHVFARVTQINLVSASYTCRALVTFVYLSERISSFLDRFLFLSSAATFILPSFPRSLSHVFLSYIDQLIRQVARNKSHIIRAASVALLCSHYEFCRETREP